MGNTRIKPKDTPLAVHVSRDGVLTIRIGVNVLAHATLRSPFAWRMADERNPERPGTVQPDELFKITNARGFAIDVKRALQDEREDGSSLLTDWLDAATQKSIEDGAEHFLDKSDAE